MEVVVIQVRQEVDASPSISFTGGGGTGATAIASAYTPYTITIPNGFYTVPQLSIWLQQYFIDQRLFLTDASGNNIYYMMEDLV